MRLFPFVAALVLAAVATSAAADPDRSADRMLTLATAHLEKGREMLAEVPKRDTNAARLYRLDRALYYLRRSRTVSTGREGAGFDAVRADASRSLVRALTDQADIYYHRKSLSLAGKRVDEALSVDPGDDRARTLKSMIAEAESTDIYESGNIGTAAIQRIRDRRAAAGIPLRDRGISRRR